APSSSALRRASASASRARSARVRPNFSRLAAAWRASAARAACLRCRLRLTISAMPRG
ncbi:hypothetical protein HMPREF0731_0696, partial [Pseudoroseomonas cervicalis ATCC 49957]